MSTGQPVWYRWRPIELPPGVTALGSSQVGAFVSLWERQRHRLEQRGAWGVFIERMNRWWCIETGVIERIFDLSLGATNTLIDLGFYPDLVSHHDTDVEPGHLVAILEDHRSALDMVMDFVGGSRQLTVAWIRELHALLTRHQDFTDAKDALGRWVKTPLIKGDWKKLPNNPTRSDGTLHEYCPPVHVAAEMDRLVDLYQQVPESQPEVRAAWIHHAFTQIHPFQDGNGRVARALASLDLIKARLFPLLVPREAKTAQYLPALEAADQGDLRPLVSFFVECIERVCLRAISEAEQSIERQATIASVLDAAKARVVARVSHEREQLERRIDALADAATKHLEEAAAQVRAGQLSNVSATTRRSEPKIDGYYYRGQIVEIAKRHGYWANVGQHRAWARLRLKDGGVTDLVVVFHSIGLPAESVVAACFLAHRDASDAPDRADLYDALDVRPLLVPLAELTDSAVARLTGWLHEVVVQGLARWARTL